MSIPENCTYVVILRGHYRAQLGWIRGTWADKLAQRERWINSSDPLKKMHPSQYKVYINGVKPHAFAMRFDFVREATGLEIGLHEQEQARTGKGPDLFSADRSGGLLG